MFGFLKNKERKYEVFTNDKGPWEKYSIREVGGNPILGTFKTIKEAEKLIETIIARNNHKEEVVSTIYG